MGTNDGRGVRRSLIHEAEIVASAPGVTALDLRHYRVRCCVVDVDAPRDHDTFPAASAAYATQSVLSVLQVTDRRTRGGAHPTWARRGLGPVASIFCAIALPGHLRFGTPDTAVVRCGERYLHGADPTADHCPLASGPSSEIDGGMGRRRSLPVDVGVDRCSGGHCGAPQNTSCSTVVVPPGLRSSVAAAVVEGACVAVLAVRQTHRAARRSGSLGPDVPPAAVVARHYGRPSAPSDRGARWCGERMARVVEPRVGLPISRLLTPRSIRLRLSTASQALPAFPNGCPGCAAVPEQPCGVARNNGVRTSHRGLRRGHREQAERRCGGHAPA